MQIAKPFFSEKNRRGVAIGGKKSIFPDIMTILRFTDLQIADGSGKPPYPGELLVRDDRIADVGASVPHPAGETVIDGAGNVLAPGWIDSHGHSDISLLAAPEATGKVAQGITTEICGNCGLSAFPLTERNRDHLQELYAQYHIRLDWTDGDSYRARLPRHTLRLVPLCGHNTLRAAVAGYEKRKLSAADLDRMRRILAAELDAGAAGLSSGLLYTPGCFADREEIVRLLEVVADKDKIYALHLRSEGNRLLESLAETGDAAVAAGLSRLMISHFKTAGAANFAKLPAALEWFETTEKRGVRVRCDRYPWCESQTQLSVIVPETFGILDDSALKKLLLDEAQRERLAGELRKSGRDWRTVRLIWTAAPGFADAFGRTLAEIAPERGIAPEKLAVELLAADSTGCTAAFRGMSPENLRKILAMDRCCCGTDESARPEDHRIGRSHPRGFGAMPRFFRMLKELGFSTGEAVRRMSALPAEIFQLDDRGELEPGKLADLVLFAPETFDSRADFARPHTLADGVKGVWIGGVRVR